MLTRLHERTLEEFAARLSLAQEQSGDTRAQQQQRIRAVLGELTEQRDAFMQMPRAIVAMTRQDGEGAV